MMDDQTKIQHPPIAIVPFDNVPMTYPIYQSVKFSLPKVEDIKSLFQGERSGYFYSRKANPTVRQLELMLADQQGSEDAVAFASGVGAINCLYMTLLNAGDHLVLFRESYMPSRLLAQKVFNRFAVETTILGMSDLTEFEKLVSQKRTKMVLFESPTNPMLRIADVRSIVAICKKHQVICAMDNTFAGFHQHGQMDVDLHIHSLTKYAAGHGDVMGGAIIGKAEAIRAVRSVATEIGACLDPHAAFLILRGMKTYFLRRERQAENAFAVARWLETQADVIESYYPGLSSHPEHELAKSQMKDFGGLVSFSLSGNRDRLNRFLNQLKFIQIAASLGSTETIIAPVNLFFTVDLDESAKLAARIKETSVRLSIGIESKDDIIEDLKQAIEASK